MKFVVNTPIDLQAEPTGQQLLYVFTGRLPRFPLVARNDGKNQFPNLPIHPLRDAT